MKSVLAAISAIVFSVNSSSLEIVPNIHLSSDIVQTVEEDYECAVIGDEIIRIAKDDIEMLAKVIWGEARGIKSTDEKAAVVWCILNRVDAGFASTIKGVVTAPYQFTGYRSSNPVTEEFYDLALDVLVRWYSEKAGMTDVGRVLPANYLYFAGSGGHNYFRTSYRGGTRWNWSLPSPYV